MSLKSVAKQPSELTFDPSLFKQNSDALELLNLTDVGMAFVSPSLWNTAGRFLKLAPT